MRKNFDNDTKAWAQAGKGNTRVLLLTFLTMTAMCAYQASHAAYKRDIIQRQSSSYKKASTKKKVPPVVNIVSECKILPPRNRYVSASIGYSKPTGRLKDPMYQRKFRSAPTGSVALGVNLNEKFRAESAVQYRGNYVYTEPTRFGTNSKQKISSTAILLNGYLMPYTGSRLTPYLTAGIGTAFNKAGDFIDGQTSTDTDTGAPYHDKQFGKMISTLTWQAGLGATFALSKNVLLDFNYKYVYLGKFKNMPIETDGQSSRYGPTGSSVFLNVPTVKGKAKMNEFTLGVAYKF
jgi:opacity protein-like surface antigen